MEEDGEVSGISIDDTFWRDAFEWGDVTSFLEAFPELIAVLYEKAPADSIEEYAVAEVTRRIEALHQRAQDLAQEVRHLTGVVDGACKFLRNRRDTKTLSEGIRLNPRS